MRRSIALAVLLAAGVARAAGSPPASCPAGTFWTRSHANAGDGTTYTVTAPCFVTFPADFLVTVTAVNNPAWPNADVAILWELNDVRLDASNATTTIGSGPYITLDASGVWTRAFHDRYTTGTPVNHRIEFRYQDLGNDPSLPRAHGFSPTVLGTVTYDPYPDGSVSPPTGTAPADPAASEPSGGCGSTGAVPALLGLGAVLAAAWPRRRVRSS